MHEGGLVKQRGTQSLESVSSGIERRTSQCREVVSINNYNNNVKINIQLLLGIIVKVAVLIYLYTVRQNMARNPPFSFTVGIRHRYIYPPLLRQAYSTTS